MRFFKTAVATAAAIIALPVMAGAGPITFWGSDATRGAAVTFDVLGGDLVVTLTNTSLHDAWVPTDILTAVFFTATGNPLFTRTSATLDAGSTTTLTPSGSGNGTDPGGVVGGEWAYLNGLDVSGHNEGISSTGLGIFGPGDLFPGADLEHPASPNGLQYGLTSVGDDQATGNGDLTHNTLIKNSVVFHLGLNGNTSFDPYRDVTAVRFLYGTSLDAVQITGSCLQGCGPTTTTTERVPQPDSLMLLCSSMVGLAGFVAARSWNRRRSTDAKR